MKDMNGGWQHLLSDQQRADAYERQILQADQKISSLLEIDVNKGKALSLTDAELPLSGVPFAVKDNIAVKDFRFTCGSKILKDFISPYTATAVRRLCAAGAVPVGKANLDEFGMGSDTMNSAFFPTKNPWDPSRVPGGSSGGSAAAVAAGLVPFALGSDTGGSVRQPANFCGVYGLKPTYGSVSRFGLAAYASSLETIGIVGESPEILRAVYDCMQGADPKDQTSRDGIQLKRDAVRTIGILADTEGLDDQVREAYRDAIEVYRSLGWSIEEVSLDFLSYAMPVYYTIAAAEASANLARYTGIRYGTRAADQHDVQSMTRTTREEGFGAEVKLRVLLGTYVLRSGFQDQYYVRAQKIRTKIRMDFSRLFSSIDFLMMPVFPTQAYPIGEGALTSFQQKIADRYTVTANLAGIPALSIPSGVYGSLPGGFQLLGPDFSEHDMLEAAAVFSSERPMVHPATYLERTEGGSHGSV